MQETRTLWKQLPWSVWHLNADHGWTSECLGRLTGPALHAPSWAYLSPSWEACQSGGFSATQWVNCMVSLSINNRFSILPVDSIIEIDKLVEIIQVMHTLANFEPTCTPRPRWERCLLTRVVVAAYENSSTRSSLKLKVSIKIMDTGEVKSLQFSVNSGATGLFIEQEYVKANQLTTQSLSKPILVYNANGTLNEAGSITEMVDLMLRYKHHSGRALFAVTGLGKQSIILGHSWLQTHNPEINWATGEVKMLHCSARLSEDTTVHLPLLPPPTVPDMSLHTNGRTTANY